MPRKNPDKVTLTDIAQTSRKIVKFGSIFLISFIMINYVIKGFITYWKMTHPEPPPPPSAGFGQLPAIEFPVQSAQEKPVSYVRELITTENMDFPDRAKVFLVKKLAYNLFTDDNAKAVAASYNFIFTPQKIDTYNFRWIKSGVIESVFDINTQDFNFSLTTDYLHHPEIVRAGAVMQEQPAVDKVKSFLSKANVSMPFSAAGMLPTDMDEADGKVTYLKLIAGELAPAVSLTDAELCRVDLQREDIDDKYKVYSPNGNEGIVSAVIVNNYSIPHGIGEIYYRYHPLDYEGAETYYIRSPESAWQILQAGEGYIVNKGENPEAVIREISLGYYDAFDHQDYFQPIYVFKGDLGFLGFVPAIDPAYIMGSVQQ